MSHTAAALPADPQLGFRALADPTRRNIYLLLREHSDGLTAGDVAEAMGLHANVARHHLEKLVGGSYVEIRQRHSGGAGRPAKVYRATEPELFLDLGHGPLAGIGQHHKARRYLALHVILDPYHCTFGNVGMLGEDYAGYFSVGDEQGLAELLWRAEKEPSFLAELTRQVVSLQPNFDPATEQASWVSLLSELETGNSRRK